MGIHMAKISSYQEPTKERVRRRVLSYAVRKLTHDRSQSFIVRPDELEALVTYATNTLAAMGRADLEAGIRQELEGWRLFREDRASPKTASNLRVIYLCGPEPMNDLGVLLKLGISPHNVWAVESNEKALQKARSCRGGRNPVKTSPGPVSHILSADQRELRHRLP